MTSRRSIVASLIDEICAGRLPDLYGVREWIPTHRAVPVIGDIGGFYSICEDGRVLAATWDNMEDVTEVRPGGGTFNMVMYQGATKYEALRPLMPQRPVHAVDCAGCDGTGNIARKLGKPELHPSLMCSCGGLGWKLATR